MRLQHSWRGEGEDRNGKVHFTSRIWIQELNTWHALAKELKGCCARHTRYLRVISSSISHRAQSGRNDDCFPNGKILIHFSVWREMPLFFNVWFVSWNREKSCPVDPPPLLPFNVIFSFWGGRVFSRHGALKNEWRVANGLSKKNKGMDLAVFWGGLEISVPLPRCQAANAPRPFGTSVLPTLVLRGEKKTSYDNKCTEKTNPKTFENILKTRHWNKVATPRLSETYKRRHPQSVWHWQSGRCWGCRDSAYHGRASIPEQETHLGMMRWNPRAGFLSERQPAENECSNRKYRKVSLKGFWSSVRVVSTDFTVVVDIQAVEFVEPVWNWLKGKWKQSQTRRHKADNLPHGPWN